MFILFIWYNRTIVCIICVVVGCYVILLFSVFVYGFYYWVLLFVCLFVWWINIHDMIVILCFKGLYYVYCVYLFVYVYFYNYLLFIDILLLFFDMVYIFVSWFLYICIDFWDFNCASYIQKLGYIVYTILFNMRFNYIGADFVIV